jgi:nucleoside-diphosphate-sugar epimerase
MGYYKFIDWMLKDQPVIITGDGHQVRGNTYVDDVAATMLGESAGGRDL